MDGEDLMDLLVSQLGTFGNDETPAEGVADSLLCIKRKMHHIKDTKNKQNVLDQFI